MVGRLGLSGKTKAHKRREIDVLIFQFGDRAARYSNWLRYVERGTRGEMCSLLSASGAFVREEWLSDLGRRVEIPSRERSGQQGWRLWQRGARV